MIDLPGVPGESIGYRDFYIDVRVGAQVRAIDFEAAKADENRERGPKYQQDCSNDSRAAMWEGWRRIAYAAFLDPELGDDAVLFGLAHGANFARMNFAISSQ